MCKYISMSKSMVVFVQLGIDPKETSRLGLGWLKPNRIDPIWAKPGLVQVWKLLNRSKTKPVKPKSNHCRFLQAMSCVYNTTPKLKEPEKTICVRVTLKKPQETILPMKKEGSSSDIRFLNSLEDTYTHTHIHTYTHTHTYIRS